MANADKPSFQTKPPHTQSGAASESAPGDTTGNTTGNTSEQGLPKARISANDRLGFTVFIAAVLHAFVLFGVGIKNTVAERRAPSLNITLATHNDRSEPDKADFIAQFNQQASGSEQETLELTTLENVDVNDRLINEVNPVSEQAKRTRAVITREIVATSSEEEEEVAREQELTDERAQDERDGDAQDIVQKAQEIASLRAKIDRIKEERARQPRVRRLTSVSTKKSYDAAYLNGWAEQFEAVGNRHFPQAALDNEILGALRLKVVLLPDGSVESVKVMQSSGHGLLDASALQFVRLAAPFAAFPPEIRSNTDKLEIYRTIRFDISGLSTSASWNQQ